MGGARARTAWMLVLGALLALAAMAPTASAQASYRVISGHAIPITQVPFQVRLQIDAIGGTFECGGSIVDQTHVITAAHCVTTGVGLDNELPPYTPVGAGDVTVYYGSASQHAQETSGQSKVATDLHVPPQYTDLNPLTQDSSYDIAVLEVPALPLGANVQPVPLANPHQTKQKGNAFVSGWGLTNSSNADLPDALQGVRVPLRPDSACSAEYGSEYVGQRSVCAGGGSAARLNPDTCEGDSGGPIAVDIDNSTTRTKYVLLGATSFGNDPCGQQNAPGAYTYTQGTGIAAFIKQYSTAGDSKAFTSGNYEGLTPAPAPTPAPAAKDTTRPKARVSALKCRRRKCAFRVRTSDKGSGVKKLSAKLTRRVKTCRRGKGKRRCKTVTRTRRLKPRKIRGGYRMTATLHVARYRLSAVATDKSGNRSKTATKRFRVRRR